MLLRYCLPLAVALCCEVSAGPCRPRSSSSIATGSSTVHTDGLVSSTSLLTLSSVEVEATTVSTVLESFTSMSSSRALVIPSDSTLAKSSDSTSAYELLTSTDLSAQISASVVLSSVTTVAYSDTSTSDAALTTTITSSETAAKPTTASTTEERTTTSTTSSEPIQPTNYYLNGGFEIPNDVGEYTGTPSLLGRDIQVKSDPIQALSGTHYAEQALPAVAAFSFRQSFTGLDPAKRYAYTYNWATKDIVALNGLNAYLKFTSYIGNSLYELEYRGEIGPDDRYVKRKIVFGGNTATASTSVQTRAQSVNIASGSIRFDDISIFEYDPPCTLLSPTPQDKWCGLKGSVYSTSKEDKAIGKEQSLSLEDCLQSCHLEPTCQVISYVQAVGNNLGRCWRFKVPREDMEYVANSGGHNVYEPGCFSFK